MKRKSYDVVIALTYYAPYVSGLTVMAQAIAEGLAASGRSVCVVTTRHDRRLPRRESIRGVDVIRTGVWLRIGKGVISPAFPWVAARTGRRAKVLHLHLPMLEAGLIAMGSRPQSLLTTYHCDVSLPPSLLNRLQVRAVDRSSDVALRRSAVVAVTSDDYAKHSRLWPAMRGRTRPIPPPCVDRVGGRPAFRDGDGLHVGFLGRIVEEKGLEYLVDGFRALPGPDARLVIAGDFSNVAGGSVIEEVRRHIADDERITTLGFVADEQLPDFYASIDVFALPSVNSLEAFGIVQVEAMMQGVPVIASDLPGVRVPVQSTGFGIVVPPRDPAALTTAMQRLWNDPPDRGEGAAAARRAYGEDVAIDQYQTLIQEIISSQPPR